MHTQAALLLRHLSDLWLDWLLAFMDFGDDCLDDVLLVRPNSFFFDDRPALPKVTQANAAFVINEKIGRLDVAMHQVCRVNVL